MTRKKTQEEVAQSFALKGHFLVGKYEGKDKKVEYRCKCGKEGCYVTPHTVRRPEWAGCAECAKKQQQETCLEKYGSKSSLGNKEIREKAKKTNIKKYGTEFVSRNAEVKKKIAETNIKKYGATSSMKNAEVKAKANATNLKKYGSICPLNDPKVKKKAQETLQINYGVDHPMKIEGIKEKMKETCIKKYGVPYVTMTEQCKKKCKETSLEKYGVEFPMQNPEVFTKTQKARYKIKIYTFPSGRQMDYQGYEHFAIDLLLKRGIPEENIHNPLKKGIRIPYTFKEKNRLYNPDIFVDSLNLLVEVKSSWTYKGKKEYKELCLFKLSACREQGYKTLLLVFSKSGEILKEKSLDKLLFSE